MNLSTRPLGVFSAGWTVGVLACGLIGIFTILPLGTLDAGPPPTDPCVFVRGDVSGTPAGDIVSRDLFDAALIFAFLYNVAPLNTSERPACMDAADVNDNGLVELSDVTLLINVAYNPGYAGPGIPLPSPAAPGPDTTPNLAPELDTPDPRFEFSIATAVGAAIPSDVGIPLDVTLSNEVPITAFTMVITFSTEQLRILQVDVNENNLITQADGGSGGPDHVFANERSSQGVAVISAIVDYVDPWAFFNDVHGLGIDPNFPAGQDHLVATLQVGIVTGADMGFAPLSFTDGVVIPPPSPGNPPIVPAPPAHNLVMLGDSALRPVLNTGGGVDIRRGFIRGDGNKDDVVDLSDPIYLLDWIFRGMPPPPCLEAANANNDSIIDLSDPIWLLQYLFKGGPPPSEPFPNAGLDPSQGDTLGCESD